MQMNHPLWPVVRESARRVVRIEKIIIQAPEEYSNDITHLCNLISEKIPQRSTFPSHEHTNSDEIWIYDNTNDEPYPIAYIGLSEPHTDVCWIELKIDQGFFSVLESCEQLLNAGYPGCVGCDNSLPEGRWNENTFRQERKNRSN